MGGLVCNVIFVSNPTTIEVEVVVCGVAVGVVTKSILYNLLFNKHFWFKLILHRNSMSLQNLLINIQTHTQVEFEDDQKHKYKHSCPSYHKGSKQLVSVSCVLGEVSLKNYETYNRSARVLLFNKCLSSIVKTSFKQI